MSTIPRNELPANIPKRASELDHLTIVVTRGHSTYHFEKFVATVSSDAAILDAVVRYYPGSVVVSISRYSFATHQRRSIDVPIQSIVPQDRVEYTLGAFSLSTSIPSSTPLNSNPITHYAPSAVVVRRVPLQ